MDAGPIHEGRHSRHSHVTAMHDDENAAAYHSVIPAQAGIQGVTPRIGNELNLGPRRRGGDDSISLCHSGVTVMDGKENTAAYRSVIPAKAGIQGLKPKDMELTKPWTPAYAGVTKKWRTQSLLASATQNNSRT